MGFRNDYFGYQTFNNKQLLLYADENERAVESDGYSLYPSLTVSYGLTNDITLGLTLPYSLLGDIHTGEIVRNGELTEGILSNLGAAEGWSDIILYGQWLLFNKKTYSALFMFGSSVPSGAAYVRDNQGHLFAAGDQPGRGAFVPYVGLALTKVFDKDSLSGNLYYSHGFEGAQEARVGDALEYSLAYVHSFYTSASNYSLSGICELNGGMYGRTVTAGVPGLDSGGNILVITPGIRLVTRHQTSPFFAVSVPLMQTLHGIQSKERYVITLGLDFQIL